MKTKTILIIISVFILQTKDSFCAHDKLALFIYVTTDHLVIGAKGGFLPAKRYQKSQRGYILFSDNPDNLKGILGIYNKNDNLYLSYDKRYMGKENINIGDSILSFLDISDSNPNVLLYSQDEFNEKPITVLQYLSVTLFGIKERYKNHEDSDKLKLILNPKLVDSKIGRDIDSLAKHFGYEVALTYKNYKPGNNWIKNNLNNMDIGKMFGSDCCLDSLTSLYLDSALSNGRAEKQKRWRQKD